MALLGDAAHAMTPNLGQGGAQAIEDAWVLADRLAACPSIDQAQREYEGMRMAKVCWVVKTAWKIGKMANARSPWLEKARNLAMRWTPAWVNDRQFDRLYSLGY